MKKLTLPTLLLAILINYCNAQIINSSFENWIDVNNYEQLEDWNCDGDFLGACTQVEINTNNAAVRMDNSLPCSTGGMSNPQFSNLGNGSLSQFFEVSSSEFTLSYDLTIDSIDQPASFIITLYKSGLGKFFEIEYDEIINGSVSHNINMPSEFGLDNIEITMKPRGHKKVNALHDCDLGYISAIIDNVQVEKTVSTADIPNHAINLYPNPSSGFLNINTDLPNYSVQIYSIDGVQLRSVNNKSAMDISQLPNGTYILSISDAEGNRQVQKFIVLR